MKPRIKVVSPGSACGYWICQNDKTFGYGGSPKAAYANWLEWCYLLSWP